MTSSTPPQPTSAKVLIVGAGIGGLVLAALLEKAGISYEVFERAKKIVPLGSAISFGPNVMYFFEQLGIADEIKANSKHVFEGYQYNERLENIGHHIFGYNKERYGHFSHIIPRPSFCSIIYSLVPESKIHLGIKVLSFVQDKGGVTITTSDNQTHHGDILVGADGAYSAVRQALYQQLDQRGKLPVSDKEQLPFTNICLVGTTEPLGNGNDDDKEKWKFLEREDCYFVTVIGDTVPYTDNRICWFVLKHLNKETNCDENSSSCNNIEWGPEAAEAMCNEVRHFRLPQGVTVGDLIDKTPKEYISKVMLEEKLFETWNDGRVVLLGDACHKMHPAAGLGAVSAIHDAVVLASRLFGLPSTGVEDIEDVFREYRAERYPLAINSYRTSKQMANMTAQGWINVLFRKFTQHMPLFVWFKVLDGMMAYRPQCTFLPIIPDRGTQKPAEQTSLKLADMFPQPVQPSRKSTVNYK
ncbi:hypothetical protein BGZ65_002115 [Modicella reniformis]|uniref:FAD-binding domain-containing protein n=1 Tax=Modicella reniformis TaxID=1440133 RepID=A0A9P6ILH8_9FUNG|nr:hypothetical protein BGZ65_002115 [Modicella reniformis]